MNYLSNENVVVFDVDETLLFSKNINTTQISIEDPYDSKSSRQLFPSEKHIKLLKDQKAKGRAVVVWSHGGAAWAKAAVDALGLASYVDIVMSKPIFHCDDLHAHEILGTRIYLEKERDPHD